MSNQNRRRNINKSQRTRTEKTNRMNRSNSTKDQRRQAQAIDAEEQALESSIYKSKSNPYTWYANFPNYARDVASLAFGVPVGQPVRVGVSSDVVANAGIMTIDFIPSPGISTSLISPLNRQAARFQTYLRSIQRAAAIYDAADTMLYMLALDSAYTYWAFLRRVYGVAQLFTPTNKYYPRRLLQAMGVSPDIAHNLADFRAYVNRFALNIGRFALPKEFDLIQRHMWMCSGLYLDSNTTRAQTYVFCPTWLWQFDPTATNGGQLIPKQLLSQSATPQQLTLAELQTFGDELINALENDDDTMAISGDMYRAYGPAGLMALEETPDNYAVLPVYDETVLSQIENSVAVGPPHQTAEVNKFAITQDPSVGNGAIIFNPEFNGGEVQIGDVYVHNLPLMIAGAMLNAHWDSPTPEQVMEMTRLTSTISSTWSNPKPTTGWVQLSATGADIVEQYRICVTSPQNPDAVRFINKQGNTIWTNAAGALIQNADLDWLALAQQFDWGPMVYIGTVNPEQSIYNLLWVAADVDNFTYADSTQMFNIHEAATLSLLDITAPIQK